MIHFICDPEDEACLWLASRISACGMETTVSLPDELLDGSDFSLSIIDGIARPYVRLASGIEICVNETRALFSRMQRFPAPPITPIDDADLIYATEEIRAAIVGWFHAWECPVIGRPEAYCAWGDGTSTLEMRVLAAGVGLPTCLTLVNEGPNEDQVGDTFTIICVGETILSSKEPLPTEMEASVLHLAALSSDSAPSFNFVVTLDGPVFDCLVSMPDFRIFGKPLVDACMAEFAP